MVSTSLKNDAIYFGEYFENTTETDIGRFSSIQGFRYSLDSVELPVTLVVAAAPKWGARECGFGCILAFRLRIWLKACACGWLCFSTKLTGDRLIKNNHSSFYALKLQFSLGNPPSFLGTLSYRILKMVLNYNTTLRNSSAWYNNCFDINAKSKSNILYWRNIFNCIAFFYLNSIKRLS